MQLRYSSAIAIAIMVLSFCAPAEGQQLDAIRQRGKLVMLCFPHMESAFVQVNLEKGAMVRSGSTEYFQGFDVDLMQRFAASLGVSLEIRPVQEPRYSALIPELIDGHGDLIASSFTITDTRAQTVSFSRPYFHAFPVVIAPADSDIQSFEDLRMKVGAVAAGSSHLETMRRLGVPEGQIRQVDFTIEAYTDVLEEKSDFMVTDSTSALRFLAAEPKLKIVLQLPQGQDFGIAVRKDDDELRGELDRFLEGMERSGDLARLKREHFGD
jgi:ABC-type amino acid transport substrate-binding protein